MRGSRDVLVTAEAELREVKQYVDELTMGDLIGPAFVIDVSARSAPDAPGTPHTYLLTADDILQFEATHQLPTLPAGAIVLIRTGWAANWAHGAKVYLGE